jgi:hypothetical protein
MQNMKGHVHHIRVHAQCHLSAIFISSRYFLLTKCTFQTSCNAVKNVKPGTLRMPQHSDRMKPSNNNNNNNNNNNTVPAWPCTARTLGSGSSNLVRGMSKKYTYCFVSRFDLGRGQHLKDSLFQNLLRKEIDQRAY